MNAIVRGLDALISAMSPKMGLRRSQARLALALSERARLRYDGATGGRRASGWSTVSSGSANSEVRMAYEVLRDRSRDLVRNNRYGARAISQIKSHMIGAGIVPVWHSKSSRKKEIFADLWAEFAEQDVLADFEEVQDVYGLQGLIAKTVTESGECLVVKRYVKDKRLKVPVQLQVLEPDYLDGAHDSRIVEQGKPFEVMGIEFDSQGKRSGYWLFPRHPGEMGRVVQSVRVSVENVIHGFRRDRPGQVRGIPWLAPCILDLKDLDDYEDAQLIRQKIAACFSAFVTDDEGGSGPNHLEEDYGRLEPGRIEGLPPGKSITFASPPAAEGYDSYTRSVLRGIAVGVGVTYEMLTGDYSRVNFTSGRMGKADFWQILDEWQWQMFIPQVLRPIGRWFLEACDLAGYDTTGVWAEWVPPRRPLIDPTREVPSMVKAIRGGLQSRSQTIRELGYDPLDVEREYAEENRRADDLGLTFDSDPRKITSSGQVQAETPTGRGENEAGE